MTIPLRVPITTAIRRETTSSDPAYEDNQRRLPQLVIPKTWLKHSAISLGYTSLDANMWQAHGPRISNLAQFKLLPNSTMKIR